MDVRFVFRNLYWSPYAYYSKCISLLVHFQNVFNFQINSVIYVFQFEVQIIIDIKTINIVYDISICVETPIER